MFNILIVSGTLWEGRYKSCLIEAENYLIGVYRYIELNPVRANMVKDPSEYQWSSYQINALGKLSDLCAVLRYWGLRYWGQYPLMHIRYFTSLKQKVTSTILKKSTTPFLLLTEILFRSSASAFLNAL